MSNDNNSSVDDLSEEIRELSAEERSDLFRGLRQDRLDEYLEVRAEYLDKLKEKGLYPEDSPWAEHCRQYPFDPVCRRILPLGISQEIQHIRQDYIKRLREQDLLEFEQMIGSFEGMMPDPETGFPPKPPGWPVPLPWPPWGPEAPMDPLPLRSSSPRSIGFHGESFHEEDPFSGCPPICYHPSGKGLQLPQCWRCIGLEPPSPGPSIPPRPRWPLDPDSPNNPSEDFCFRHPWHWACGGRNWP